MPTTLNIRRNDQVQVMTGRDKGKQGRVLRVYPAKAKLLVEHVMVVKKHVRPNPQKNIKGGIAEQESPISIANVALICTGCNKPSRVGFEERAGRRVRVCKRCGNSLEK